MLGVFESSKSVTIYKLKACQEKKNHVQKYVSHNTDWGESTIIWHDLVIEKQPNYFNKATADPYRVFLFEGDTTSRTIT